MTITRDSSFPLGFVKLNSETPDHIAGTIIENLQIGEFCIKYRMRPVVFIRIANWREKLWVLRFNPKESGSIILSDYREYILSESELEYYFTDVDKCRVVLVGEEGYSSFKITFDQ